MILADFAALEQLFQSNRKQWPTSLTFTCSYMFATEFDSVFLTEIAKYW